MDLQEGDRVSVQWERRTLFGYVRKVDAEHGRALCQVKTEQYRTMRLWVPFEKIALAA